jgi:hypothetical protein
LTNKSLDVLDICATLKVLDEHVGGLGGSEAENVT